MTPTFLDWVTNTLDEYTNKHEFVPVYRDLERHGAYEWLYRSKGDPLEEDRLVVSLGAWASGPEDNLSSWQFQAAAGLTTHEGYTRRTLPSMPAEDAGLGDEWHFTQLTLEPAFVAANELRYEAWTRRDQEMGATESRFVAPRPFPPDRSTGGVSQEP